jgi:hypothetical protein
MWEQKCGQWEGWARVRVCEKGQGMRKARPEKVGMEWGKSARSDRKN